MAPAKIKNIILTIIVIVMIVMIGFLFFNLIATPEFLIKREIESISKDYYEKHFYEMFLRNNSISKDSLETSKEVQDTVSELLEKRVERGFSPVSFRQLLLYDDLKHADSANGIAKYCDLDKSFIKIYPESPFKSENYRIEYTYSCNF